MVDYCLKPKSFRVVCCKAIYYRNNVCLTVIRVLWFSGAKCFLLKTLVYSGEFISLHRMSIFTYHFRGTLESHKGFPGSSAGKESICNAGDSSLIPGMGRSSGERIGYPLQYSWVSLVAQLVENLPSVWETWVWLLGWGRSPGEGTGYPLQYSGLENSMDCIVHGVTKSQTLLSNIHFYLASHGQCNINCNTLLATWGIYWMQNKSWESMFM